MAHPAVAFAAKAVAVQAPDDLNAFVVVLAEHDDGSGERLELQRAIAPDEQDVSLGMDTYCVCLENGACAYGGIQSCSLDASALHLELSSEAAARLGVANHIVIGLDVSPHTVSVLRQGLCDLFADERDRPSVLTL